jgi:hypothetical protein
LTRLSVRNLACFGDADYHVDFAPETVIIGPNNVGKSVFLGGFNFLRNNPIQGSWAPPDWSSPAYNWGDFQTIVHRHDTARRITVAAELRGEHWTGRLECEASEQSGVTRITASNAPPAMLVEDFKSIWFLSASRSEVSAFIEVGSRGLVTRWRQGLNPDGSNVVPYLLERYTRRDPRWEEAEKWLNAITNESVILKSPLSGNLASVETNLTSGIDVNVAYQGTGVQKALSTVAALVFSPNGSTIIIEEPEIHLHKRSQQVLIDLINKAVNDWKKQVIFTTHSWDMVLPFVSDVGKGSKRGQGHVIARPENFKLVVFDRIKDDIAVSELDIKSMEFMDFQREVGKLWG